MASCRQFRRISLFLAMPFLAACYDHTDRPDFEFEGAWQGSEDSGVIRIQFDREESSDYSYNDDDVYLEFETESGTAEAGVDFFPATGVLAWDNFDFKARSFDVILIDDAEVEGTEYFLVRFPYSSLGMDFTPPLQIEILDDDGPAPPETGTILTYVFEIGEGKDGIREIRLKSGPEYSSRH